MRSVILCVGSMILSPLWWCEYGGVGQGQNSAGWDCVCLFSDGLGIGWFLVGVGYLRFSLWEWTVLLGQARWMWGREKGAWVPYSILWGFMVG